MRRVIARMTGAEVDAAEWSGIRDRLATFFARAHGAVLAPAAVFQESKHDLDLLLSQRDIEARGTLEERRARLQGRLKACRHFSAPSRDVQHRNRTSCSRSWSTGCTTPSCRE